MTLKFRKSRMRIESLKANSVVERKPLQAPASLIVSTPRMTWAGST